MREHRNILSAEGTAIVGRLAAERALLAFDFDGTLVSLSSEPGVPQLRSQTRDLLSRLALRHSIAVISGRGLSDLLPRVEGLPLWRAIGNHGLEPSSLQEQAEALTRGWAERVRPCIDQIPGAWLEDKGASLSVHLRRPGDWQADAALLRGAVGDLPSLRIIGGKRVLNLLPDLGIDKGTAIADVLEQSGAPVALYVGDDQTDEDVFRRGDPRIVGVRVGDRRETLAPWFVPEQEDVLALLEALAAAAGGP